MPHRIRIDTTAPYDVVVGTGLMGSGLVTELRGMLPRAQRIAVVHPVALTSKASTLASALVADGFEARCLEIPDGEVGKDLVVAAHVWDALGERGFTRSDALVSVGGGATTDLVGFVAATWLRGVDVVHVPTTLLGMVDAAVGGKTAINTAAGKNLVGAFHEPAGVICDLDDLTSLPAADYVSGLAEVIKVGLTHDPCILDLIEEDPAAAATPFGPHTQELVERAIRVKGAVVADDLTEQGGREALNYGHTLGHAIERSEDYRWRHGFAVSVGLVFAAELAQLSVGLDPAIVQRHRTLLHSVGLPTTYDGDWPDLLQGMRLDKKSRGDRLRFVVLEDVGRPRILDDPDRSAVEAAWERVRAPASGSMPT